jgi:hypothetical protein
MVKPEDRVECRSFHNTHVSQSKNIVEAVVERFEVSDRSTVGLIADLVEWLVSRQQLVQHVAVVGLLLGNALVRFIIAAGSIDSIRVLWKAHCMVPILECEFTLFTD